MYVEEGRTRCENHSLNVVTVKLQYFGTHQYVFKRRRLALWKESVVRDEGLESGEVVVERRDELNMSRCASRTST